jgi:hypothetical protein
MSEAPALPRYAVTRVKDDWDWKQIPALPPMQRADGSGPARQQTKIRACHDGVYLRIRFDCDDTSIWGNYTRRDDPIYEEEAVEVFIAPGTGDPAYYFEFEVNPDGVLWDGRIVNAGLEADDLQVDQRWNCEGIHYKAERNDPMNKWHVWLALPLKVLSAGATIPNQWRANFYRIDRPFQNKSDAMGEFSCWSPTLTRPAAFHKPRRFGYLDLL